MSYFEFDDVKRIHQPYTDSMYRGKRLLLMWFSSCVESAC